MRASLILTLALAATACDPDSRRDVDLDGVTADIDCDDYNNDLRTPSIWFEDLDGDGWAAEGAAQQEACTRPDGFTRRVGDCDDAEPTVNPSAPEACNGEDDDCDGFVDEQTGVGVWYADVDGDGFGDPEVPVEACDGTGGLVTNARDCDDANAEVRPGADEICDGIDNNCDSRVDESTAVDATNWYTDRDGDGFGVDTSAVRSCDAPGDGWTQADGDCNDGDVRINPDADELCDTVDNDCDGRIDGGEAVDAAAWYPDNDRDGYGNDDEGINSCFQPAGYIDVGGDCDDRDRFTSPDTVWYLDADEDDYGDPGMSTTSCEDPSTSTDIYVRNLRDCDDGDDTVNPDAVEICDEIDNNCDGSADGADATDAKTYFLDYDGDGFGDPGRTGKSCSAPPGFTTDDTDCNDDNEDVYPGADEFCDGIDNDCDTLIDRSDPDVTSPTWYLDADGDDWGRSDITKVQCEPPEDYVLDDGDCDDSNEDINPDAAEVCDAGVDNDCDGLVDRADPDMTGDGTWYRDSDKDGYGDPEISIKTCSSTTGYVRNDNDCDDTDASLGLPADCWDRPVTFSTCARSGNSGPTQSQCDTAYKGTDLEDEVTVTSGKQKWVVPFDGTFRIEAWGAQAGKTTYSTYTTSRAKGARMRGDFELEKGDELYIAVGQRGTDAYYGSGGGGASWVMDDDDDPYLVAGGGGGIYYYTARYSSGIAGCPGLAGTYAGAGTTSTTSTSCPTKTSGLASGGSAYSSVGSGGGGLDSGGTSDTRGVTGGGGWKQGLVGGYYPSSSGSTYDGRGGFGGGGAAYFGGGGGGGYSGGNGGYRGGGGGSFNDGTNASNSSNVNAAHGKVTIDYIEE